MTQSAVNYYRENILKITRLLVTGEITTDAWVLLETELLKEAKEMEKEQIEEAYANGVDDEYEYHINNQSRKNSEQYYNETYGGNK